MIGVVLVLAAGGCSAGATQEPSPTTSRSVVTEQPTATASETVPAPPEMPAEAKEMTAEGAAAFAVYWFEAVEFAYATGETDQLSELATENCEFCKATIAKIADQYASGGRFEGVDISISSPAASSPDERGSVVSMLYSESASQAIGPDGVVEDETNAVEGKAIDFYAALTPTGWRVFGIAGVE